jgi:hypothetical protein
MQTHTVLQSAHRAYTSHSLIPYSRHLLPLTQSRGLVPPKWIYEFTTHVLGEPVGCQQSLTYNRLGLRLLTLGLL